MINKNMFSKIFLLLLLIGVQKSFSQVTPRNRETTLYKTSYACEGEPLNIDCSVGNDNGGKSVLDVVRANFGRFSIAICNDEGRSDLSVNCLSSNTLAILKTRCFTGGPSSSCSVLADPKIFGSSHLCPETPKYLEVHYRCVAIDSNDVTESSTRLSTTTHGPPPPSWLTTATSDVTSGGNVSVTFQTPPPMSGQSETSVTGVTGKRRIPITPRPKVVTPAPSQNSVTTSVTTSVTRDDVTNVTTHSSNGLIKEITSKFLSSSVASTNIMDTSELPMPIINSERKIAENKTSSQGLNKTPKTNPPTVATTTTTTTTSTSTLPTTTPTTTTTSTTTTTTTFVPFFNATKENKMSKNKLFDKERIIVDILDDDHDEQPDISASNDFFDAPRVPQASLVEHHVDISTQEEDKTSNCPSKFTRGLEWPSTRTNRTAVVNCPSSSSSGMAMWTCGESSEWTTTYPDLSQCRSLWLMDILQQLTKPTSLVHLANEMEHQVAFAESLFGGDLLGLAEAIEKMTDKMRSDLEQIPTSDQRRAVVTEVVQRIVKTISTMTSRRHTNAWRELGGESATKSSVTKLLNVLENAGLLLPEAVTENEEVTISSTNVLLSVKKMNFHHMGHTNFPSSAAVASKDWSNYSDHLEIPSLVLMEHMQRGRGITEIIFVSFKSLGNILQSLSKSDKKDVRVLNSPIISLTMGRRVSSLKTRGFLSSIPLIRAIPEERLAEPITIYFEHKPGPNATMTTGANAVCVLWDVVEHDWTSEGCYLVATNTTHSQCECNRLATFALMQQLNPHALLTPPGAATSVSLLMWLVILVLAICLSVILIMSVAVVIVYCRKRRKNDGNIHKRLESSPSISVSGRRTSGRPSWMTSLTGSWSRMLASITGSESNPRNKQRRATDLFPDLSVGSTLGRWQTRDEIGESGTGSVANTPTFFSDLNRTNPTMNRNHSNDQNFMTRRTNLHLDLEPIPAMTLRGQLQEHQGQPSRGSISAEAASTRSRNALSLNFQGYRKPFLPPKELVATPERPLLEDDFPSPDTSSHIYMEVNDPQPQSRSKWQHNRQDLSLQPIHRPLQQTIFDSSASSQSSSGYGSSASPHLHAAAGPQRTMCGPGGQPNFHYDNVRGEMRGPFVRFHPEGGIATLGGHESRGHYPGGQPDAFASHSGASFYPDGPTVLDENRTPDVYLHASQFV